MKRLCFALLFCISFMVYAITPASTETVYLSSFTKMLSNEFLNFYIDMDTGEFAVEDCISNDIWFSNPPNREQEETIAVGDAKERISAQLSLQYDNPSFAELHIDSYLYGVNEGQIEISQYDDLVRVEYTIGKKWDYDAFIPRLILKESFEEELYTRFSRRMKMVMDDAYVLIEMVPDNNSYNLLLPGYKKPEYLGDYQILPKHNKKFDRAYNKLIDYDTQLAKDPENDDLIRQRKIQSDILIDILHAVIGSFTGSLTSYSQNPNIDDLDESYVMSFVGKEFYVAIDNTRAFSSNLQDVGVTIASVEKYHTEVGLSSPAPTPNIEIYTIPVEYSLRDNFFVVRIPSSEIIEPWEMYDPRYGIKRSFPLVKIDMLKYFGAAGPQEDGYLFIPDGSGSLIEINNNKTKDNSIALKMYGVDRATYDQSVRYEKAPVYLPVFGIKRGDKALFGIIEEGDAQSYIAADIAGKANSYNVVYPQFIYRQKQMYTSARGSLFTYYANEPYKGDYQVAYTFLSGEDADYSGMANAYRKYIMNFYGMQRIEPVENLPFLLELVGGVSVQKSTLGIQRMAIQPLTNYSQSLQIIDTISIEVPNLVINYSGWLDGGIYHRYPKKIDLERSLAKGYSWKEFVSEIEDARGISFYPEISFMVVNDRNLDGLNKRNAISRNLFNRLVSYTLIDPAYGGAVNTVNGNSRFDLILSGEKLPGLVEGFLEQYTQYNINGISLTHMGNLITSNLHDKNIQTRQDVAGYINESMQLIDSEKISLLLNGGNVGSAVFADYLKNIALSHTGYQIEDMSIPFYQMVFHGLVSYAGTPFNFSSDDELYVLQNIEAGASLYCKLMAEDPSIVKDTPFVSLASEFQDRQKDFLVAYKELNRILTPLQHLFIIEHNIYNELHITTYENGVKVVTNYSDTDRYYQGQLIKSRGYAVYE